MNGIQTGLAALRAGPQTKLQLQAAMGRSHNYTRSLIRNLAVKGWIRNTALGFPAVYALTAAAPAPAVRPSSQGIIDQAKACVANSVWQLGSRA